jgi:hypothetical protein
MKQQIETAEIRFEIIFTHMNQTTAEEEQSARLVQESAEIRRLRDIISETTEPRTVVYTTN